MVTSFSSFNLILSLINLNILSESNIFYSVFAFVNVIDWETLKYVWMTQY